MGPAGWMISTGKPWGDATSGGLSSTGRMRALESGADARVDQIWIEHRTVMAVDVHVRRDLFAEDAGRVELADDIVDPRPGT